MNIRSDSENCVVESIPTRETRLLHQKPNASLRIYINSLLLTALKIFYPIVKFQTKNICNTYCVYHTSLMKPINYYPLAGAHVIRRQSSSTPLQFIRFAPMRIIV